MKKIFMSKAFILSIIMLLCAGTMVVCFFGGHKDTPKFEPDPHDSSVIQTDTREENKQLQSVAADAYTPVRQSPEAEEPNESEAKDEYPKVVSDDGDNVVIDFTQSNPAKPEPPEPPKTDADITNPDVMPTYEPDELKPPETEKTDNGKKSTADKPKADSPTPGNTNEYGQVYDRVFGWVTPSKGNGKVMDSDGDPNKMIGYMGK